MRLAVAADARAAALAGLDGSFVWGEVLCAAPDAVSDADVTVELAAAGLRIHAGGAEPATRAPWPARDELFELAAALERRALVVGRGEAHADVVAKLEARGLPVAAAESLDAGDLAAATVVALVGGAGSASGDGALPAEAPAVLASRRVLIAPRCPVTFGLLAGSDHLAFDTADDVVQYADTALTFPDSFDSFRALGAAVAAPHRASVVYGRIVADVRAARRSAAPRG